MANDARIKHVESLMALSHGLLEAQECISSDCVSIANLMDQKLAELIRLEKSAREILARIETDYFNERRYYANNCSSSLDLFSLQQMDGQMWRRNTDAHTLCSEIESSLSVCRGMVTTIVEETQSFSRDSNTLVHNGRNYLSKVSADLNQYIIIQQNK